MTLEALFLRGSDPSEDSAFCEFQKYLQLVQTELHTHGRLLEEKMAHWLTLHY